MYEVDDSAVRDAVAELPHRLLAPYLELRAALAASPDTVGDPIVPSNPAGMRSEAIGPERELIVYFGRWAEPQRRVVIYAVVF